MTIEQLKQARRDLEKRLLIDLRQFELDTGVRISDVILTRHAGLGDVYSEIVRVETDLEVPR